MLFLAKQSGFTKFATEGFHNLFDYLKNDMCNDYISHNGKPILNLIKYNTGYFDDDNFEASFNSINAQNRLSSGENDKYHLNHMFDNKERLKPVEELIKEFRCSDFWQKRIDKWHQWFKAGIVEDDEPITILMDEPTKGFDYATKTMFWGLILTAKYRYQYIIATHDIPLFSNGINIIECEKGYAEGVKALVKEY